MYSIPYRIKEGNLIIHFWLREIILQIHIIIHIETRKLKKRLADTFNFLIHLSPLLRSLLFDLKVFLRHVANLNNLINNFGTKAVTLWVTECVADTAMSTSPRTYRRRNSLNNPHSRLWTLQHCSHPPPSPDSLTLNSWNTASMGINEVSAPIADGGCLSSHRSNECSRHDSHDEVTNTTSHSNPDSTSVQIPYCSPHCSIHANNLNDPHQHSATRMRSDTDGAVCSTAVRTKALNVN